MSVEANICAMNIVWLQDDSQIPHQRLNTSNMHPYIRSQKSFQILKRSHRTSTASCVLFVFVFSMAIQKEKAGNSFFFHLNELCFAGCKTPGGINHSGRGVYLIQGADQTRFSAWSIYLCGDCNCTGFWRRVAEKTSNPSR